jgi:hypothetical protein
MKALTDLVIDGDRLLTYPKPKFDWEERQYRTYVVVDAQKGIAKRLAFGNKIEKIHRYSNGAVYIGRSPVIARV